MTLDERRIESIDSAVLVEVPHALVPGRRMSDCFSCEPSILVTEYPFNQSLIKLPLEEHYPDFWVSHRPPPFVPYNYTPLENYKK
jgi:hypothetical protein